MPDNPIANLKPDTFIKTTLQIRWLTIAMVVIAFPLGLPQTKFVYALALMAIIYNSLFYVSHLKKLAILWSPVTILIIDSIFVVVLLMLVNNLSSPFTALLVFTIISSSYLYRIKGTLLIVLAEVIMVLVILFFPLFQSVHLDTIRYVATSLYMLIMLGYFVEKLTHQDKVERELLQNLQKRSDEQRRRLVTLVNSLSSAIFVTDSNGLIILYNEAARILADVQDEAYYRDFSEVLPLFKRIDPETRAINIFNETSSAQHRRDLSLNIGGGKRIDLDVSVTQVSSQGSNTEYLIVCEDISQERTLEEERAEFISVASHELRTPVATLEAALQTALLTKSKLSEQDHYLLEQAHRNSLQLADIVKDLTILAEAQNDNIAVNLVKIDPLLLIDNCVADFKIQARERGIELKHYVDPHTPIVFSTEHHIREILQNYFNNALKYTESGAVTLRAEPSKNGGALFSVQDEGIGISPSDQKMLFTKFFRAESYMTRNTGGTGLGLYLCMELAERIGAKLWCKSTLGEGSTFYLEIPHRSN